MGKKDGGEKQDFKKKHAADQWLLCNIYLTSPEAIE